MCQEFPFFHDLEIFVIRRHVEVITGLYPVAGDEFQYFRQVFGVFDEQRVMAVFDMFGAYTADRPHAIDGGGNGPVDGQGLVVLAGFKTNADGGKGNCDRC